MSVSDFALLPLTYQFSFDLSRLMCKLAGDLVKAHELWKQGGGFYRDCITWYIGNQPQWRDTSVSAANATRG